MSWELKRWLRQPLYWAVLAAGLAARAVLAYFDARYRTTDYWAIAGDFWSKIGSAAMGILILLVLIRPFALDREIGAWSTIVSTAGGRLRLFAARLLTGALAAGLAVIFLSVGNLALSVALGRGLPHPAAWELDLLRPQGAALAGAVGYFLFAAAVCDACQNQPAAMGLCGTPFALGYFVNVGAAAPWETAWFFRYGCFTELLRGRWIGSLPGFWALWYLLLLGGGLSLALYLRKERKAL